MCQQKRSIDIYKSVSVKLGMLHEGIKCCGIIAGKHRDRTFLVDLIKFGLPVWISRIQVRYVLDNS